MGNKKKLTLIIMATSYNKKKKEKTIQLTKARICMFMVKPINDVS